MSHDVDALKDAARAWLATDPDPETRAATEALLAEGRPEALAEHFGHRLGFGTAGLRGALGPGPNRMNRALVRRVAAGLADYLLDTAEDARERGVVVARDGRHGSRAFAEDTAALLADRGFTVWLRDGVFPTPCLAHAVVELGACAGVMVTASHNPPGDNGYKVYWADGAQIVPPHDAGISAAVAALDGFDAREVGDLEAHRAEGRVREVPDEVQVAYLARVQALRVHQATGVRVVYTALHGVGTETVRQVLETAGHTDLHVVAEQEHPDGDFPTVAFPNPEEPGALDLAIALAEQVDAELIVANDPDADRLAVAVPAPGGGWRPLTGNEVGCLLADDLLAHQAWDGRTPLVATTVVSSRMLERIADRHGAAYAETLTGFKWIAKAALAHEADGGRFVLGYEEALGYSAGDVARDKDGISAILLFLDLAAAAKAAGQTVLDRLEALSREHGVHQSLQRSVKLPGAEGRARIEGALASLGEDPPTTIAEVRAVHLTDVQAGVIRDLASGAERPLDLPRSNVLAWSLADGSRVLVRPSGTEPKIKFYGEARLEIAEDEPFADGEARARAHVEALVQDLLTRSGLDGEAS